MRPCTFPPCDVKRRRNQPQHAGKNKRGAYGSIAQNQSNEDEPARNGEATASDSRQSYRERNQRADCENSFIRARFENVWMPHSSFIAAPASRCEDPAPALRNRRARLAPRCSGTRDRKEADTQFYFRACNSTPGPRSTRPAGLPFSRTFPLGSAWCSTVFRFLRVGDCSRRKPVNQTS